MSESEERAARLHLPAALRPHRWDVSLTEAAAIQHDLAARVSQVPDVDHIRTVAGIDMSTKDVARAAVVVLSYPELETLEIARAERPLVFPYVPGYLSFREAPAVLAAFDKLTRTPDLLMFDGQGIMHPRRLGIAAHLGVLLDLPSIGCAKSLLLGRPTGELGPDAGEWVEMTDKGSVIGAMVRTKKNVKPLYISVGHKIDLAGAVQWVLACTKGYRLPETTRRAHNAAAEPVDAPSV
jgi:deoxyribonuclease V